MIFVRLVRKKKQLRGNWKKKRNSRKRHSIAFVHAKCKSTAGAIDAVHVV
jgi:hypothetical protein